MFITLEGIEGSGKSSQIPILSDILKKNNIENIKTFEPGDSEIGTDIRSILLGSSKNLDPLTELLLYSADRVEHIKNIIQPALKDNITVICDRFIDSTLVYQGFGRQVDIEHIKIINSIVSLNLKPDLTFLLDLDPKTGLNRVFDDLKKGVRSNDQMRFENEKIEFHQIIREGYLNLANSEPERIKIIDAKMDIDSVTEQILHHLTKRIKIK
ncbi:MAG: dTMP kinase [Deltaproteobacteria bacterium]|nr:dTMP kinase [Deltaproteobacteria bacterium]